MLKRIIAGGLAIAVSAGAITWTTAQAPPDTADVAVDSIDQASQWPLHFPTNDGGEITIFQPQADQFQGNTLKGRAAVSVTTPGQDQPVFGAVWIDSRVATDRVARTVRILDVKVTQVRFPNVDEATSQKLSEQVRHAMTDQPLTMSLDQLLEMVKTTEQDQQAAADDLKNDPPIIVFRDHPAVKVQYDGPPKLVLANDAGLLRAANTPFFVVLEPQSKTYFLKGAGRWFAAPDPLGPFKLVPDVPAPVKALADESGYKDPEQPIPDAQVGRLEIITATDPTELIWTDGQMQMTPISGTNLLYVANTDSDVFIDINTQQYYVLISGRWYSARGGTRDAWAFVDPDKLPDDFKRIPQNSEKGDVLAQVAGTQQAEDALADAQVPQTASIDRRQFDQPPVEYDGDPQFQPVDDGTLHVNYGVNTPASVLSYDNNYYVCQDAVWYVGRGPQGPWDICTNVPAPIYRIPPSCPVYPVRYVYVYGYTPDVVYCGYTPGYVGCYPYRRCVVYGTGYRYRPWYGHRYYPRPCTYGFAAHYNSYASHWGFSFGFATGGGRGWIGDDHSHHHDRWFGDGGYRPAFVHKDVHSGAFRREYTAKVRQVNAERDRRDGDDRDRDRNRGRIETVNRDRYGQNVYDRRKDVRWDADRPVVLARPAADRQKTQPPRASSPVAVKEAREASNNVFTDRNGDVYRKTEKGWEVRDKGQWRTTSDPTRRDDAKLRDDAKARDDAKVRDNAKNRDDNKARDNPPPSADRGVLDQPDQTKPEPPKSADKARPEPAKPEKPEQVKPEPAKPDATPPDARKADDKSASERVPQRGTNQPDRPDRPDAPRPEKPAPAPTAPPAAEPRKPDRPAVRPRPDSDTDVDKGKSKSDDDLARQSRARENGERRMKDYERPQQQPPPKADNPPPQRDNPPANRDRDRGGDNSPPRRESQSDRSSGQDRGSSDRGNSDRNVPDRSGAGRRSFDR